MQQNKLGLHKPIALNKLQTSSVNGILDAFAPERYKSHLIQDYLVLLV